MKKRNLLSYYDIALHLFEYTTPQTIADLHGVSVQAVYKKIKWMLKEGILKAAEHNGPYKHTYYVAGPGFPGLLKAVEEMKGKVERTNRGAILGALPPFTSQPSTQPTLDFYTGKAPRAHRMQFVVYLSRPASRPGLKYKTPHLPETIDWIKSWEFRGGSARLGEVKITGWKDPVKVQYTMSKTGKETVTITLPALYILKEWLDAYDDVKQYFYDVAKTVAEQFRRAHYRITMPHPVNRFGELAFYMPVLSDVPKGEIKAMQITDTIHIDFSKGFPEIETTDGEEGKNISQAIQVFLELPALKSKLEEHDKLLHKMISPQTPKYVPPESAPPGGIYQ